MSASAHFEACFARLDSVPPLAGNGSDSVRYSAGGDPVRANYWILYASVPFDLDDERYSSAQRAHSRGTFRYDFRPVGTTSQAVLAFLDAADAVLIGHRLEVPGRVCDPATRVREVEGGRLRFDAETRLFYLDVSYETVSRPVVVPPPAVPVP